MNSMNGREFELDDERQAADTGQKEVLARQKEALAHKKEALVLQRSTLTKITREESNARCWKI